MAERRASVSRQVHEAHIGLILRTDPPGDGEFRMSQRSSAPLAVVTGGASGIGKATVERFVAAGFVVAALDRSREELDRLTQSDVDRRIHAYPCDLAEVETLTPLAVRIVEEIGPPRALVNNAGVCLYADITETTDEMWETSLNTNLVGASALIRGFVPGMKRVNGAAIVNVASRNALSSSPRAATYDAAKAALLALTRTLAVELGGDGIRVNAVLPGFIDTPIHGDLLEDRVFVENYLRLIPLNRIGRSEDIASIIYFLASDGASFVTGQGIVADGGQMSGQNYVKVFGERDSFRARQEPET